MPGVAFGASPNFRPGGVNRPPRGMVLHIAQGSYGGTIGWQANPTSQISSYFVVAKDGQFQQEVDLADRAWTESAGNVDWIGVEFEGYTGDLLTVEQVLVAARIYAWLATTYTSLPIQATDDPVNGRGLGWHGMGGTAWGGHFDCPGAPIVGQRAQILAHVHDLLAPAPFSHSEDDTMELWRSLDASADGKIPAGSVWLVGAGKAAQLGPGRIKGYQDGYLAAYHVPKPLVDVPSALIATLTG